MHIFWDLFEASGVDLRARLDDLILALPDVMSGALRAIRYTIVELTCKTVNINKIKIMSPRTPAPTKHERAALAGAGLSFAEEGGAVVIGTPIGSDEFVQQQAVRVDGEKGGDDEALYYWRVCSTNKQ